jgi:hypothetical protein
MIYLDTRIVFKSRYFKVFVSLKVPDQQIIFPNTSKQMHVFFRNVKI